MLSKNSQELIKNKYSWDMRVKKYVNKYRLMKYFLSSPIVEQKDLKIVKNILKKGILYPDIEIENKFSKSVGKYSGYKYNLPLSSGTAALHLALKTLEIKKMIL